MLSHERVWAAIDALASRHGLRTSRLARKAGLDATSFNKSKRVSRKGREHWPSTESISKILEVTGTTLKDFLRLIEPLGSLRRSMIPLIGMEEAASGKIFTEDGMPGEGPGRDAIEFPNVEQEARRQRNPDLFQAKLGAIEDIGVLLLALEACTAEVDVWPGTRVRA